MKKFTILLATAFLLLPATFSRADGNEAGAQKKKQFNWEAGVDFQYIFDNREFAYSDDAITPSMTVNTAVLAPTLGFSVKQAGKVRHRLRLGVELAHDMGSQTWDDFLREFLMYYDARVKANTGTFEGVAGIFPRHFLEGNYSEAFFSDSLKIFDRNLEGVLFKWRSERFYTELCCDWMGQYGYSRRERFQVISFGDWNVAPWLSLGWTGSFYHFACSVLSPGVVDNHMLEPWAKLSLADATGWQELSLQAGLLVSYQWDRVRDSQPTVPIGGEFVLTARRWNVMLQNTTYVGQNMLTLYDKADLAGIRYGHDLYFGQPFYTGFYDRIELAWTPAVSRYVDLKLGARAHFNANGFAGWQQEFSVRLKIDNLFK